MFIFILKSPGSCYLRLQVPPQGKLEIGFSVCKENRKCKETQSKYILVAQKSEHR